MATTFLHAPLNQKTGSTVPVTSSAGNFNWQTLIDDDDQWKPGWTSNRLNWGITAAWDPAYDNLLLPGNGAYLLGFVYTVSGSTPPFGTIFQFGRVASDNTQRGLRIWQDSTGSVVFDFFDDNSGTPQLIRKFMNSVGEPGEKIGLFCYFDNRGDRVGSNSLMLFRYELGSIVMKQQGQPILTGDGYSSVSGGPLDARKQVRIGHSINAAANPTSFLSKGNRVRDLVVFNFGAQAPNGVNKLMETLSLNWMAPSQKAFDLAGVTSSSSFLTIKK